MLQCSDESRGERDEPGNRRGLLRWTAFRRELMRHAQSQEEIIYPTAVLIGEYVKLMVAKDAPARNTSPAQR